MQPQFPAPLPCLALMLQIDVFFSEQQTQAVMWSWETGTNDHLLWKAAGCEFEGLRIYIVAWVSATGHSRRNKSCLKYHVGPCKHRNVPCAASSAL